MEMLEEFYSTHETKVREYERRMEMYQEQLRIVTEKHEKNGYCQSVHIYESSSNRD